ncbi:MAG: hypothetical protein F6K59_25440 [Moorea sp. SIO3F7]|nr:hypothetical protein [Moorena sp. SIO3E8]NEQ02128.1 hypothetical protein [Moorena sp. SIO3F7]
MGRWGDGEMGRWGDLIEFSVRVAWPTANRVAALLEHRTDFTELSKNYIIPDNYPK